MELLQIKYFKRVAELEHITNAAIDLRIAQPALSKTIKNLEIELGVELFNRNKRSIFLNENGKILLKYANEIDACLNDMKKEIGQNARMQDNTINILLKITPTLIPKLIYNFNIEHPDIKFKLFMHNKNNIDKELNYDFKFYSPVANNLNDENSIVIMNEHLMIAVPKEHRLADKKEIDLNEVSDDDFICLSQDFTLWYIFDNYCKISGFSPKIILECNDYLTMRGLIEAGIGIALVPGFTWGYKDSENIHLINIKKPICTNSISLSWKANKQLSKACNLFKEYTIDFFSNYKF